MSLATSCPSCGTIFKVVEDQLKVSEGWVRCGHCHEVFNALEGLFDLAGRQRPQFSPRPAAGGDTLSRRSVLPVAPGPSTPSSSADQRPSDNAADWIETRPAMFSDVEALRAQQLGRDAQRLRRLVAQDPTPRAAEPATPPDEAPPVGSTSPVPASSTAPEAERTESPSRSQTPPTGPTVDFASVDQPNRIEADPRQAEWQDGTETEFIDIGAADTVFQPHEQSSQFGDNLAVYADLPPVADEADARGLGAWHAATPAEVQGATTATLPVDTAPAGAAPGTATLPTFMRQADRAAWWRKPMVRMLLALGCVCAAAALLLQLTLHHRDSLAGRWPPLHAPLAALCEQLSCTLQAPRQLDALVVENTALTRPAGVDGYRLQVLLRNRVDFEIRAPHLELSLTDSAGAVIVRRVLSPADFRQAETLSASADGSWQLELSSSDKRIAGYAVAAFYP
jgi:predicted Zn finger-like uncharacterized protein